MIERFVESVLTSPTFLLFWSALVFSLSMGLFAAFPVNVLLVRWGVKKGTHSPKEMAKHAH